ncbi:MAG: hypothetical protein KJ914_17005 [Gammaproteobacteria bacterium]|nr:hypothetical protein [Gammaproteobacteria bacterium]MBU1723431.1 hypothetical protein [Gammaproteobacteria bacterium]MBU2003776.1 hypothetical protein [Gammaproteobacteria bacterium]
MSKIAGIFILGVLAGWLIEWIFVRLFVPNPKKKVEAALQTARKENEVLQKQVRELQASTAAPQVAVAAKPVKPEVVAETAPVEPVPAVVATVAEVAEVAESAPAEPEIQAEPTVESVEPTPSAAVENGADDLTKLSGIGPKLAEAMKAAGINRFGQVASMGADEVGERLATSGIRYSKTVAESWAAQAKLAETGDWGGLKRLQASLKA